VQVLAVVGGGGGRLSPEPASRCGSCCPWRSSCSVTWGMPPTRVATCWIHLRLIALSIDLNHHASVDRLIEAYNWD
jgi:hypothetical protein